jgi:epoxyqueuosine reductase QueG
LGWIGKSALLITERYGAAVRLATILTDAQFRTGNPIDSSLCGDCMKCAVCCPAKAISGKNWKIGFEREFIFDALACCATAKSLSRKIEIQSTICGICINVCPWTQEYISRELTNMNKRSKMKLAPSETDE